MTSEEKINCLTDRPCIVCKYHKENGCSKWACVFEQEPTPKNDCENCIHNKGVLECDMYGCKYEPTTKNDLAVDCISRKAVLDAIDSKAWEFCDYLISKGRNDEQKPVSHFADNLRECVSEELTSVTPQEPCEDCVSRDVVKNYIQAHIHEIITESGIDKNAHTNGVLRALLNGVDTMPSATPQESRWIPVTERLPEENGGYLVTVKRGYVTTALWVGNAENWEKVTAWMPLPEPYREVEE